MFKTALSTPGTATFPRTRNYKKKNTNNLFLPKFFFTNYLHQTSATNTVCGYVPRTRNIQQKKRQVIFTQKVQIIYIKSIQNLLHYPFKYFIAKMRTKNKTLSIPCAATFPRTRNF